MSMSKAGINMSMMSTNNQNNTLNFAKSNFDNNFSAKRTHKVIKLR